MEAQHPRLIRGMMVRWPGPEQIHAFLALEVHGVIAWHLVRAKRCWATHAKTSPDGRSASSLLKKTVTRGLICMN